MRSRKAPCTPPSHARRSQPLEAARRRSSEPMSQTPERCPLGAGSLGHATCTDNRARAWPDIPGCHRSLCFPQPRLGALSGTPFQTQRSLLWEGEVCPPSRDSRCNESSVSYCGRVWSHTAKCAITPPSQPLKPDLPARENTGGGDGHLPLGPDQ